MDRFDPDPSVLAFSLGSYRSDPGTRGCILHSKQELHIALQDQVLQVLQDG